LIWLKDWVHWLCIVEPELPLPKTESNLIVKEKKEEKNESNIMITKKTKKANWNIKPNELQRN
jgi:hypothetical protein